MLGRSRGCIGRVRRERGGASYDRRAVATAKWAAIQISGAGKGLKTMQGWLVGCACGSAA